LTSIPELRLRTSNQRGVNVGGDFILYWMIAARRTAYNFALDRAIELASALRKPLVILEPLRAGYPFASDRFHSFVLEGMADNAARLAKTPVFYYPYVEPEPGAGAGLLKRLADSACLVVTDEYPAFFLPKMVAAAAQQIRVGMEQVDSNGLLPLRASTRVFTTAKSFRIFLHRNIREHLASLPKADPLRGAALSPLPDSVAKAIRSIQRKWPAASPDLLAVKPQAIAALPIDHAVGAVDAVNTARARGGARAAGAALSSFLKEKLDRYPDERDHPDSAVASGLSPYLHFGHLSAHEVFAKVARQEGEGGGEGEGYAEGRLDAACAGKREGFWGMSPAAEAFLDQLVTWREIGFNVCDMRPDYDQYASLPGWARATLEKHAGDPRPVLYSLEDLEGARTYDRIWNASQTELVREGRMQNYLRMLWGKKILEWTRSPEEALSVMLHLNNKYALDGRDPNSYSGIFWVLGRYDRAWGPERPIFGTIRYMSSESAARKLHLKEYLRAYGPAVTEPPGPRSRRRSARSTIS
jgi:deoxyribodipyrimidine photo-lyase